MTRSDERIQKVAAVVTLVGLSVLAWAPGSEPLAVLCAAVACSLLFLSLLR